MFVPPLIGGAVAGSVMYQVRNPPKKQAPEAQGNPRNAQDWRLTPQEDIRRIPDCAHSPVLPSRNALHRLAQPREPSEPADRGRVSLDLQQCVYKWPQTRARRPHRATSLGNSRWQLHERQYAPSSKTVTYPAQPSSIIPASTKSSLARLWPTAARATRSPTACPLYDSHFHMSVDDSAARREARNARQRAWRASRQNDPAWQQNRRDYNREYSRKRREDPEERAKHSEESGTRIKRNYARDPYYRLREYKKKAGKRGKQFLIPDEIALMMFQDRCTYCREKGAGLTGIDRADNSLDYIVGNSVPCCGSCNISKHTRTADEFIAHCRKVAAANPPTV